MQVHVQELYSLRLVLVLMEDGDDKRELKKLRQDVFKINTSKIKAEKEFNIFTETINTKRTNIENMKNKGK